MFRLWQHYKQTGGLQKTGGWEDQPLALLIQVGVIQLVHDTITYKNMEDSDWNKFSATQLEIIRQVENGN